MSGWEWAAIAFGTWCALSIPAAILTGRWLRTRTPAPGNTRVPAPGPGEDCPEPSQAPPYGQPSPALTPHETAALTKYATLAGIAIPHGHVLAGREIADGLRQGFPHVDDTTLGIIALDLHGYGVAVGIGVPDPTVALQALINAYAMAAEDLTRLARTEVFDARD